VFVLVKDMQRWSKSGQSYETAKGLHLRRHLKEILLWYAIRQYINDNFNTTNQPAEACHSLAFRGLLLDLFDTFHLLRPLFSLGGTPLEPRGAGGFGGFGTSCVFVLSGRMGDGHFKGL
jgi:hypothetical protein